tara:strand:+ start:7698 stop:8168 length:471 start_codon:yes stop_codon:yes gene_type:complete
MRLFLLLLLFTLISNCKLNKIDEIHGVPFLEKQQQDLIVNESNRNDILMLLGQPSTKSSFNNDLWIYIERKKTGNTLRNFGKKKIYVNNVLLLEVNNKGLLVSKELKNINDMNEVKFDPNDTAIGFRKRTFVYDFVTNMIQKINDPMGTRKKRLSD